VVNRGDQNAVDRDDEIDIVTVGRVMWKARYMILLFSMICGLAAVCYALLATPIFRGEVVITEAHDQDMDSGSGLSSKIGGLASLAGLDMSENGQDADIKGVLNSRHLIEEFIKRQNLLPVLVGKSKTPTMWFAVRRFKDRIVTIREDKRSNLTSVDIDWTDPKIAAQWANDFVAVCNDLIRAKAINEASRNLAYLTQQLAGTNIVDMQRAIDELIASQMKKMMLASGRVEYAYTVIDPAVPAELRKSPQRVIVVIVGVAVGLLIGIMTAFMRERLAHRRRDATPL
jgi:uncharacterized protein involved in exopolysaccharide biosynthesis